MNGFFKDKEKFVRAKFGFDAETDLEMDVGVDMNLKLTTPAPINLLVKMK